MTALSNIQFDYDELDPDELKAIKLAESQLSSSLTRLAEEMLNHGEILADAQTALANQKNGVFLSWLESRGISSSSAYRCIDAYKAFGKLKLPTVGSFEVGAMYTLAKNDKAIKKAVKLAENGTKVTQKMAKELIEASPPPKPKADPPPNSPSDSPKPVKESPKPKQQPTVEPEWFQEIAEVYEDVDDSEPEPEESVSDTRFKSQKSKTRKTFEAGLRAIGDLHELKPDAQRRKSMIDTCMSILDELKGWTDD
jgi:hypothetical protein